jgi:hypothetical protein
MATNVYFYKKRHYTPLVKNVSKVAISKKKILHVRSFS